MFGNAVDISTYQGNISFDALKAAGVKYVLIRIGYGRESYQIDNQFMNNYRKAKAAGIPVGGYFFSYADSAADAIVEANNCLSMIKGLQFELPIFYDVELDAIAKLGKRTVTNVINNFIGVLKQNNYEAGLYTNPNWLKNYMYADEVKTDNLWLACWSSSKEKPNYKNLAIWQYGGDTNYIDGSTLPGINGNIDKDVVYKDYSYIKNRGMNGFKTTSNTNVKTTKDKDIFLSRAKTYIHTNGKVVCSGVGLDYIDNWCAYLISLIMKDCNFLGKYIKGIEGGAGSIARNADGVYGDFFKKGSQLPKPGDIVMFRYEPIVFYSDKDQYFSDHVGVVVEVKSDNNTFVTIEGNIRSNDCTTSTCDYVTHYLTQSFVHAFYRPRWQETTTSATGNKSSVTTVKETVQKQSQTEIYQVSSSALVSYDVVVTAKDGLNMRQGASTTYKKLGAIPYGKQVHITNKTGGGSYIWGLTVYEGIKGWIALNYTKNVSTSTKTTNNKTNSNNTNKNEAVYYTIKAGDTLTSIAKKYNTTVNKIVALNNISNPDLIYGGTKIRVK